MNIFYITSLIKHKMCYLNKPQVRNAHTGKQTRVTFKRKKKQISLIKH